MKRKHEPDPHPPAAEREYIAELPELTMHAFDLMCSPQDFYDPDSVPVDFPHDDMEAEYYYRQAHIILALVNVVSRSHQQLIGSFYAQRLGNSGARLRRVLLPDFAEFFMYYLRFSNESALRALVADPDVWQRPPVLLTFASTRRHDLVRVAGRYSDLRTSLAFLDIFRKAASVVVNPIGDMAGDLFLFLEEAWKNQRLEVANAFMRHLRPVLRTRLRDAAQCAAMATQSPALFQALNDLGCFDSVNSLASLLPSTFLLEQFRAAGIMLITESQRQGRQWLQAGHTEESLIRLLQIFPDLVHDWIGENLAEWKMVNILPLTDQLGVAVLAYARRYWKEEAIRRCFWRWGVESLRVDFLFAHQLTTDAEFQQQGLLSLVNGHIPLHRTYSWKGILDVLRRTNAAEQVIIRLWICVNKIEMVLEVRHWEELQEVCPTTLHGDMMLWLLAMKPSPNAKLVRVLATALEQRVSTEKFLFRYAGMDLNSWTTLLAWHTLMRHLPAARMRALEVLLEHPFRGAVKDVMRRYFSEQSGFIHYFTSECSRHIIDVALDYGWIDPRLYVANLAQSAKSLYQWHNGPRERASLLYFTLLLHTTQGKKNWEPR